MTEFELDESKALSLAFQDSRARGKIFNINNWKKNREEKRLRIFKDKK